MRVRRHPAVPAVDSPSQLSQGRGSPPRLRIAALLGALGALLALGAVFIVSATATPGCASTQTTSPDGTIAYGSACSDEIVVTSPLVEKVFAGGGNDVIYASDEVEEVYGGAGGDVLYGGPPEVESETGPEDESGIDYEPSDEEPEDEAGASASSLAISSRQGPLASISNKVECTSSPCYGGDGNQEMFGGPGADIIFGQRGNDTLNGEAGADALYGGIGDDRISGDDGADALSGGLGTDTLDGNEGTDHLRGDGTVDVLRDTGKEGDDTLSFSTAVAPGFVGPVPITGFPPEGNGEERGVSLRLDGAPASCGTPMCNNDARYGGGGDEIAVAGFERVIGSAFADYIVGTDKKDVVFGGGGSDVIITQGGGDILYGGGERDYLNGGADLDTSFDRGTNNCTEVENANGCTGSAVEVVQRDRSKITVGRMTTTLLLAGYKWESFYAVGSSVADNVSVKMVGGEREYLVFTAEAGSAEFDTTADATAAASGCEPTPSEVKCRIGLGFANIDSITLAGMAGDDRLSIASEGTKWPEGLTPVLLGGQGNDNLFGSGLTEDVMVDGDGVGNDTLHAYGFDDALLNNEGSDQLIAGGGSDLLLSITTCGGDTLQGAEGKKGDGDAVNNASWAQLPPISGGVVADLKSDKAGGQLNEVIISSTAGISKADNGKGKGGGNDKSGAKKGSRVACASGALDRLHNIDDLEGSSQSDALYGDARSNNLLGRNGEDLLFARGGEDRLAAQDGERDEVGGGGGVDVCAFDEGLDSVDRCP